MGLATTHGIVHDHGGHVVVESPAESGALFRVLLPPTTLEDDDDAAEHDATPAPDRKRTGHILLVDDEQSVREFMSDYLENRGYTVCVASNGQEALDRFDTGQPHPDLVITDQTMPGMTGIELAEALGERPGQVPVILYTGYGSQVSERQVEESGVDGYLKKPLDLRELNGLLDSLLLN
jgi:CheY-like chemotaxis protein